MTAIPILLYHAISPDTRASSDRWCVHPDRFAAQLDMVLDLGFTPMTVSGLVDTIDRGTMPDSPIVVTFDDGRADFVEHALPILRRVDVPSTMYVVTGLVGAETKPRSHLGAGDIPLMSWADIVAASEVGVEIGAHSTTHQELDVIARRRLPDEVAGSRRTLGEHLGQPVRTFAYPYGYHSGAVTQAVRHAGYDSACAVGHGWSHVDDDRFALTRMFVYGTTTTGELRHTLLDPPSRRHRHRVVPRAGWRFARRIRRLATRVEAPDASDDTIQ